MNAMQNKIKPKGGGSILESFGGCTDEQVESFAPQVPQVPTVEDGPGEVSVGPRNKHQNDMLMQSLDVVDVLMDRRVGQS